jgi:HEAT repeat protein
MKKRLLIAAILVAISSLGIALVIPRSHFALMGLVHGEVFYDGRPVSYWSGAFRKDPFIGDLGDVGKTLREGGPAAVPVLCRLLADEDDHVRSQALIALHLIDFDPNYVAPTLTRMFVRERASDFVMRAIAQLAEKNPAVFAKELQWALAEEPGPERRAEIGLVLGMLGQEGWSSALQVTFENGAAFLKLQAANVIWKRQHDAAIVLPTVLECLPVAEPNSHGLAEQLLREMAPIQKDAVRSGLIELLKHKDAAVRARAARLLLQTARQTGRSAATVEACLSALHDQVSVRREATALLTQLGPLDAAAQSSLRGMLHDPDVGTRLSAAVILVQDADDSDTAVLEALVDGLNRVGDTKDREQAASTLGEMKASSPRVVAALIAAVERDSSQAVRTAAFKALGEIGPPARVGVGTLMKLVEQTGARSERVDAARTLGMIARDEQPVSALLAALATNGFPELRAAAANALGNIALPRKDVEAGLTRAMDDLNVEVRCEAAVALFRINPQHERPIKLLMQLLRSSRPATRDDQMPGVEREQREVITALGRIGPSASVAVPMLIPYLDRDDLEWAVIEALKAMGPAARPALPAVQKLLQSSHPWSRFRAATLLWSIERNPDIVVPVLAESLKDSNHWTRLMAAEALAQIGPSAQSAVPALRALLDDDDPTIRRATRKALRAITQKSLSLLVSYPFVCGGSRSYGREHGNSQSSCAHGNKGDRFNRLVRFHGACL